MELQQAVKMPALSNRGKRIQYAAIVTSNLTLLTSLAAIGPLYTVLAMGAATIAIIVFLSSIGLPLFLTIASHATAFQGNSPISLYYAKIVLSLGLFGLFIVRVMATPKEFSFVRSKIDREFLLFLAWGAFCALFATVPIESIKETFRLAVFLPIFIVTRSVVRNENHVLAIAAAAALAIMMNGVASGYEYTVLGFHRIRGLFGNANFFAMFLMYAIPMTAVGMIASRRFGLKAVFAAATAVGTCLLLLSWSRAAILGLSVAFITYLILERKKKLLLALVVCAVLLPAVLLIVPQARDTVALVLRLQAGTTHRTTLWTKSVDAFERSPIVGLGYNVSRAEAGGRINWNSWEETILFSNSEAPFYPHNLYLYTIVTIGLPGLLLLLRLYWKLMADQRRSWLESESPARRQIHRLTFAIILGSLFHGLFESGNIIHYISWASYFWLLLGIVTAIRARKLLAAS